MMVETTTPGSQQVLSLFHPSMIPIFPTTGSFPRAGIFGTGYTEDTEKKFF
jgi:hypothetical protein